MPNLVFTSNHLWYNGIAVVRIMTAVMIIPFGLELFDSKKMDDLTGFLTEIQFPLATPVGYLAKIIEFFGAILLAVGLFTRIITVPLMLVMAGVIYTMSEGNIFVGGFPFLFLLLFLVFFLIGPGKWSLDHVLFDNKKTM